MGVIYKFQINDRHYQHEVGRVSQISEEIQSRLEELELMGINVKMDVDFNKFSKRMESVMITKKYKDKTVLIM